MNKIILTCVLLISTQTFALSEHTIQYLQEKHTEQRLSDLESSVRKIKSLIIPLELELSEIQLDITNIEIRSQF